VVPIPTSLYPTPAQRPSYSLLDCTETRHCLDLYPCHWREALVGVLEQVQLAARM
jgi:dTDP-4-dehydrorhamnose reductase